MATDGNFSAAVLHFDATSRRRDKMRAMAQARDHKAAGIESPEKDDSGALQPRRFEAPGPVGPKPPSTSPSATVPGIIEPTVLRSPEKLESFLVNFVVEQTGYPAEIVELDADLEADLGIDSIKKAQMFGELREYFDITAPQNLTLDDFPTLRHVVNFLLDAQPKEASADPDGALAMPARPIASPITDNRPRPPQTAEPPGAPQPTPPNQSPVAPPSSLGDTIDSILQTLGRILSERGLAHASDLNLTESTQLIDELGLDSLSLVDLITAVENEFAITLNFDDMKVEVLNSAGEFASLIQLKIKETARVSSGSS